MKRRNLWAMGMATLLASYGAVAQDFPAKHITIVVPYAAGGPTDVTARRLAEAMSKQLDTPIVVENKPGAATTIAAAHVAKAPNDGHTLLMSLLTTTAVNPHLYRSLPYSQDDFAPISLISRQPVVLTVSPDTKAQTVDELVAQVRNSGQPLTHGSTGTGSQTHIIGQWVGQSLDINVEDIPYKGTSASTTDVVSGRLQSRSEAISTAAPLHKSGKARVLAVMADDRSSVLPDVPTFKEHGHPDIVTYLYLGLLAPAGTPAPVLEKLHTAAAAVVASPEFAAQLDGTGEEPMPSANPAEFGKFLKDEYTHWGKIIEPLNIKLD